MKKYTVFSVMALTCLSMKAAELIGERFAGYTTQTVPAGFSIVAVPFSGFDMTDFVTANLSLDKLISTNGLVVGDRLIAFNEETKNYYYYDFTENGWDPLDVTELGGDSTNHVVTAPALSTITEPQGYAFWFKPSAQRTLLLQGIANTNAVGVVVAANMWTLVGNALPASLDLNAVAFINANPWFLSYSPDTGPGDEIQVVNGTGYLRYYFFDGRWKKAPGYTVDADPILAGSGVWFFRRGDTQTLSVK